ncbi:reverse transcriptase domain-containing protein [Tanacetum coccineum]
MTNLTNMLTKFVNSNTASTSGSGTLPSNTITNPKVDLKGITTRSGVAYQGPTIPTTSSSPPKVVERETEVTKDTVPPTNNGSTKDVQPPVVQVQSQVPNSEPVVAPVSAPMPNPKSSIPYPSRPLIGNKEKLSEMARTPLNEHCSAVILNKLPKKLGDPGKFLIPCDFPGMDECLALADLGASINLMPLSVWKKLSLPELTPTCMTLELADRSITQPIGIAEDVYLKVGKFKFPADFVVIDFDADPRVPLILGRSFLKTGRALIDIHLELRYIRERIDVIEMDCEEYSQEVLGFSDVIASGNPTPYYDPIVSTSFSDPQSVRDTFLNDDPSLLPSYQGNYLPEIRKELKVCEAKTDKSSIEEPRRGRDSRLTSSSRIMHVWKVTTIARHNCKAFECRGKSRSHKDKMLQRCEDTNLCLNWEKSHFMVKEGIVLGHKIFKNRIEVDKAKVECIAKLPPSTTLWGGSKFSSSQFSTTVLLDFSKIS